MELKEIIEEEHKKHKTKYGRVGSYFKDAGEVNFITFSGHFYIKFENGYEVSIFNGAGSYTDNLYLGMLFNSDKVYSKYIEIAIIKDGYFHTRDFITSVDDDVLGLVTPNQLIDILDEVRKR